MSGGDDDDDYDKNRRVSLTQAYRRNTAVRPPLSTMSGQRRIAINNGNHPIYKVSNKERNIRVKYVCVCFLSHSNHRVIDRHQLRSVYRHLIVARVVLVEVLSVQFPNLTICHQQYPNIIR